MASDTVLSKYMIKYIPRQTDDGVIHISPTTPETAQIHELYLCCKSNLLRW